MANKKVSADTVRTGIGEITIQGDLLYTGASDLERLAKGTAAQVLTMNGGATAPSWADAAVELPAVGSSGNLLTSNGSTWASTAPAGGGKVLQVVTTDNTSTGSTTSTSWASAGMTVTITPSATSSKVLLLCTTAMYNAGTGFAGLTIFRGLVSGGVQASVTNTNSTWGFQAMRNATSQTYYNQGMAMVVVDAPATTSAQLYTLAVKSGAGNQIGINYGAGNTSFTAMEIGA